MAAYTILTTVRRAHGSVGLLLLPLLLLQLSANLMVLIKADGSTNMTTFCGGKPDGLYANPQSCFSFWACWDTGSKGSLVLCPPNTLWSQPSLSCSHTSIKAAPTATAPNTSIASSTLPSNASFLPPHCTHSTSTAQLSLPIWHWDGLLHCYGYGCLDNGHGLRSGHVDIGIPCIAAQALLSIAKHHTNAWIPAPHQFLQGDLNLIGGQHWKVRFDSVEKDHGGSGLNILKASITDYSPSQRILDSWQGGPREAQFVLEGPRRSPVQGGCYYSVSLEGPSWEGVWEPFMKEVVGSESNKFEVGSPALQRPPAMADQKTGNGWRTRRKGGNRKGRVHTERSSDKSVQACLASVPWASLVATAMCYASNMGGGLESIRLCSDFPSDGLLTVAKCVTSLMGISSELGL